MSDSKSKLVKLSYVRLSLANLYNVNKDLIKELQWSESKGAAADDGYTTELVAVKGKANVSGKIEEFSFMVKLTPEIGPRAKMVDEMGLFLKEYLFYGVIIPLIEKERKLKGLGNLPIPKCFYANPDPGVLVMKNLNDDCFDLRKNQPENMSKISQEDATILFMKALASLHASTHHLVEQTGGCKSFLDTYPDLKHIPTMPDEVQWEIFKKSLEATIEEGIELTKGQMNENSIIKLAKFKSIAWETVDNSYYETIGDYQTLNHGDAWQNNAMFRCENGRAKEIALIDFQYTRMTSPAVDVIYAIYTGSEPDMRTEHLTKWLKIYHDQFSYELNVFGYDANSVYPFTKFQQDVHDLFPIGLTWAFITSKSLKVKNEFGVEPIDRQMDPEQSGFNSAYHQRLTSIINEAIRNKYI